MRWIKWFLAGALAVPLFHHPVLWLFNVAGMIDRMPYSMDPTKPFGVPQWISLSFWGGVWGLILLLVIGRMTGAKFLIVALLFGAIAPTLVAGFVIAPLKGQATGANAKMALIGFSVNAAWGIGTALLARLFEGWRATSRNSPA